MADRYALGCTLELALAAEDCPTINLGTWKKALKAHPELSPHYEAARGKFLEMAMRRMAASDELSNLRWLLERRHPDLFSKPEPCTVNVSQHSTLGIPADILERARALVPGGQSDSVAGKGKPDE